MSDLHSALAAMFRADAERDHTSAAEAAFEACMDEVRQAAHEFWGDAAFASQPDPDQQPALLEVRAG